VAHPTIQALATALARQPAFIIIYGAIKLGKTCDALMSFPHAAFIAAPGALKAALGVAGFSPPDNRVRDVASLPQVVDALRMAANANPATRPDAMVIDDLTLYVQRQVSRSTLGGFDLWGAIYKMIVDMRDEARRCGMHVVVTMHESPPHKVDGRTVPGTVMLPGNKLPFDVPAAADMVLRAQPMTTGYGNPVGWPVVYRCNASDPEWRTGDRHNVTPDMSPMNIGEILRLYARENNVPTFAPRRLFAWQEDLVAKASEVILARGVENVADCREVLRALAVGVRLRDTDERHVMWTLRDAWDRAVLTHAMRADRLKLYLGDK
jgi:hypothetical protein